MVKSRTIQRFVQICQRPFFLVPTSEFLSISELLAFYGKVFVKAFDDSVANLWNLQEEVRVTRPMVAMAGSLAENSIQNSWVSTPRRQITLRSLSKRSDIPRCKIQTTEASVPVKILPERLQSFLQSCLWSKVFKETPDPFPWTATKAFDSKPKTRRFQSETPFIPKVSGKIKFVYISGCNPRVISKRIWLNNTPSFIV